MYFIIIRIYKAYQKNILFHQLELNKENKLILGISGSPRLDSVTSSAVKKVLEGTGLDSQFISLSGRKINGCISCLGCTKDNECSVNDDFNSIAMSMLDADAIVFGAPNYYGTMNSLSHALWERCFSFRHRGAFSLKGKPIIFISTGYSEDAENNPVLNLLENFAQYNKMNVVSKITVGAFSQCYTCNYSNDCIDGNVVRTHGVVDVITPEMLPDSFEKQSLSIEKCLWASSMLKKLL